MTIGNSAKYHTCLQFCLLWWHGQVDINTVQLVVDIFNVPMRLHQRFFKETKTQSFVNLTKVWVKCLWYQFHALILGCASWHLISWVPWKHQPFFNREVMGWYKDRDSPLNKDVSNQETIAVPLMSHVPKHSKLLLGNVVLNPLTAVNCVWVLKSLLLSRVLH